MSLGPRLSSKALSSDVLPPPPQRDQRCCPGQGMPVVPGFTSDAFGGEWLQWGRAPASSNGEGSSSCRREKGEFGVHVRTLALEGSARSLGGL